MHKSQITIYHCKSGHATPRPACAHLGPGPTQTCALFRLGMFVPTRELSKFCGERCRQRNAPTVFQNAKTWTIQVLQPPPPLWSTSGQGYQLPQPVAAGTRGRLTVVKLGLSKFCDQGVLELCGHRHALVATQRTRPTAARTATAPAEGRPDGERALPSARAGAARARTRPSSVPAAARGRSAA